MNPTEFLAQGRCALCHGPLLPHWREWAKVKNQCSLCKRKICGPCFMTGEDCIACIIEPTIIRVAERVSRRGWEILKMFDANWNTWVPARSRKALNNLEQLGLIRTSFIDNGGQVLVVGRRARVQLLLAYQRALGRGIDMDFEMKLKQIRRSVHD